MTWRSVRGRKSGDMEECEGLTHCNAPHDPGDEARDDGFGIDPGFVLVEDGIEHKPYCAE